MRPSRPRIGRATTAARPGVREPVRRLACASALLLAPLATHTSLPSPLPRAEQALARVTSYEIISTTTFASADPSAHQPPGRETIIAVRKRRGVIYYARVNTDDTGRPGTLEVIFDASRACRRINRRGPYTCGPRPAALVVDPLQMPLAAGTRLRYTAARSRTVGRQTCAGYAYTMATQGLTWRAIVFLSAATFLPCELDQTVTGGVSGFTGTQRSVWVRYNDPTLSIPAAPGF